MKTQKRTNKETGKLAATICCGLFIFMIIGYILFVTFYVDPKWDQRMEKELVPVEQVLDEGNQKDDGNLREREEEIEKGEKTTCPDNYSEMIGGETHE